MAETVLLALSKIGTTLGEEATKAVITKLSEKVTNLKELPAKVKEIKNELKTMNNVIQQIGTAYLTDEVVKGWIAEVRELAFHVEDVMDKYSYYARKLEEEGFLRKLVKGSHYVTVFSGIADEIIQIERKVQNIIKRKENWLQPSQLASNPLADIERHRSQDCFPELVKDEDLVGIEDNRRLLTKWLYTNESGSTVITVSGIGGLGKTTLVTNVFEREKVNFPVNAWIVASQTYTVDGLLRKLLQKIGYTEPPLSAKMDKMDVHDLKVEIKRQLKDTKCMVVLDDVWDRKAYIQMRDALQNLQASRIIITTRNKHVAALAPPTRCLDLKPLNSTDALELLCRRAFLNNSDHVCPPELDKLGKDIVDRCEGLPLAIVSIGGLLSSLPPTSYVWNEMYNQLRSELVNNNNVRAVINLSYHDLPGDLRNCFLYCSMFPEDYPMSRESLVRLWVAEGFAVRKEQSTPEEMAERYLRELIHRNMLEVAENDELGRVSTCKMHDIMRDLALSIAKEERFGSANDYGTMLLMDREYVRRFSTCGWRDNSTPGVTFPCLRTLLSLEAISPSTNMLSSIMSESNYLTVMELQDSAITELPASVGNLFNLRYIGLRRTLVKSLPESIERLSYLNTLDIKQTKIEKLPRGLVKVKNLRHLFADRFVDEKQSEFRYFIGVQVPKGLSSLEELQTLETVEASKDLAKQLEKLMQLRSIWIDNIRATDCEKLFSALSKMPFLSSLLLSACDENETLCFQTLKPTSTKLHRLIVRGHWATGTLQCPIFQDHGKNLKYLALSWCQLGEDPLGVLASHVPNLTYLRLNNMHTAKTLVLSAGSFPHLKTIVLKHMPDVNQVKIMDGALPVVEGLYIQSLSGLARVPQGIETLYSLKKLWLRDLHEDFKAQWIENEMHQKMQHVPELRV